MQFRDVVEVHSVDAGDEGQGNEDRGDDRQHLHDLVHPVADAGKVEIHDAGQQVPLRLD